MMKKNWAIEDVNNLCFQYGANIVVEESKIVCFAPAGSVWKVTGLKSFEQRKLETDSETFKKVCRRMSFGLERIGNG